MPPPDKTPYQPSNGSEGCWFIETRCDKCHYEVGARECPIIVKTMVYDPGDTEYPKEWVWSGGCPTCTKFKKPEPSYPKKDYQHEKQRKLF